MSHELLKLTGWCHQCGRATTGLFCVNRQVMRNNLKAESSMTRRENVPGRREDQRVAGSSAGDTSDSLQGRETGRDDQCRRRYEREQAVQTSRQIRRGKRANYGAGSV